MEVIKAKQNKRAAFIRSLMEKGKERKKQGLFIVEGIKMVNEALRLKLANEVIISEQLVKSFENPSFQGSLKKEVEELKTLISKGNEATVFSDALFSYVCDTVHPQGAIAIVRMPLYSLEEILRNNDKIRILILESLSDPGNLGTIIRTAEAAGINAVIMDSQTVDVYNPKVVRATMGSIFRVPLLVQKDLCQVISHLKQFGFCFYAAHLKGSKSYKDMVYTEKVGLLIGNEAKGLSEELSKLCDTYIRIPMEGKVESLNAAIAAAILMYEMR